jgi:hypothetical protein
MKPNVHYHAQKNLKLVLILGQMNPVYTLPSYFLEIHFNIMLPFMPRSSYWSLFFSGFPTKLLHETIFSSMHATHPAHLILLDFAILVIYSKE